MRARALAVAAVACAGVLLAGAASGTSAPRPVALEVRYHDGSGNRAEARLTCRRDRSRATGFLRRRSAPRLCRRARELAGFLAGRPDGGPCAQVYGGPDRAVVGGRIGSRAVHRRFARRDGCEIADWDRARALLPRPRGADRP